MTNTTTDNQPSSSAIEIIRQLQSNGVIGGETARYLKELIEIQTKAAYSKGASDALEKVNKEKVVVEIVKSLRWIHEANRIRFKEKHGREAEVADQLKKHAEEVGEFIKALDGKNDEPVLNELWDSVFSMMATVLNPYQKYSDEEIGAAFTETMNKIAERAIKIRLDEGLSQYNNKQGAEWKE